MSADTYMPQPRVWLGVSIAAAVVISGSWLTDALTGWMVDVTGSGERTNFLPWTLALVSLAAAGVAALAARERFRPPAAPFFRPPMVTVTDLPARPVLPQERAPDFLVGEVLDDSADYQPISPDLIA